MQGEFSIAITGDTIINRRVSTITEERFLSLIKVIRDADLAYTQLETLIHDYDGPETYPSAEGGGNWMRSPHFVAEELKWAGFDIVSHASNHSLDYSYGGLFSTWKALDEVGIPHAGTGRNLAEAREPVYLDTRKGRVALISMCSSYQGWARAGETRRDVQGRPGLNPLRYHYVVDSNTMETIKGLGMKLGWWVRKSGKDWLFYPPGLHLSVARFSEGDQPGVSTVVDEEDAEGNIRSIREARRQADWVLVHLHNHEFDPDKGLAVPAGFVTSFARTCIDAGGDIFVGQGSHAMPRGIEIYDKKPIFYDPGDFMFMINTVTKLPADFYSWRVFNYEALGWKSTPADGFDLKETLPKALFPAGGVASGKVVGSVIAVCSFGEDKVLKEIKLHPLTLVREPRSRSGLPLAADSETAKKLVGYLGELSSPFGTKIEFREGIGLVVL